MVQVLGLAEPRVRVALIYKNVSWNNFLTKLSDNIILLSYCNMA